MDEIRCEIRLAEVAGKPSRLTGVLMAYNKVATDRRELFEAGALKWDGPLVLNRQHNRAAPILRFEPVESEGRVLIDVEVPSTTAGADALSEVRSGLFRGLSIEFRSIKEVFVNGIRRISSASLVAAALVDSPSYSGSVVEARARAEAANRERKWREYIL